MCTAHVVDGFYTFSPDVKEARGSPLGKEALSPENKPPFLAETALLWSRNPTQKGGAHKGPQNLSTLQKVSETPLKIRGRLLTPERRSKEPTGFKRVSD